MIKTSLVNSIELKKAILADEVLLGNTQKVADLMYEALNRGNKVFFCGNGGSAADAQHLAAELVGKFYKERPALPAIALNTNISCITAIGNDYSYDDIFLRQIQGLGSKGDVLFGLSTSGNSKNVIAAFEYARNNGIATVGLSGLSGGDMKDFVDVLINVPSTDTPRIQEAHITLGHIICEMIENNY